MSSEAKNLEAISKAIDHHNSTCDVPAVAVAMNPFEVERLGWDDDPRPADPARPASAPASFRIVCGGDEAEDSETEVVEAVSDQYVPVSN